ncbi:Protein F31F7.1 a, partial [Aphelenchoides avenae]
VVEGEDWLGSIHDYVAWRNGHAKGKYHLFAAVEQGSDRLLASVSVAVICATTPGSEPLTVIGNWVTHPDYRGCGIGSRVFDEALKSSEGNTMLYSVESMSETYARRYGLAILSPWRMRCITAACSSVQFERLAVDKSLTIKDIDEVDCEKIHEFDSKILPNHDRRSYLEQFLTQAESWTKIVLNPTGGVAAICHARLCHRKELGIGPLYADDNAAASTSLRALLESIAGLRELREINMKIPATNGNAFQLFDRLTAGQCDVHGDYVPQSTKRAIEAPGAEVWAAGECDTMLW